MKLFLIGCIIGLGKILPGISGSILAIRLGVYERVVEAFNTIFQTPKKSISYLMVIGSGFLISIILGSKILLVLFLRYSFALKILFLVFLLSGIPEILHKSNSPILFFLTFGLGTLFFLLPGGEAQTFSLWSYFFMGVLESFSTIVPGISGTAIFLSLGWYEEVLSLYSTTYLFSFSKLFCFGLGLLICAIFLLKIVHFLLQKYPQETYSAIFGFFLSSIFFVF